MKTPTLFLLVSSLALALVGCEDTRYLSGTAVSEPDPSPTPDPAPDPEPTPEPEETPPRPMGDHTQVIDTEAPQREVALDWTIQVGSNGRVEIEKIGVDGEGNVLVGGRELGGFNLVTFGRRTHPDSSFAGFF